MLGKSLRRTIGSAARRWATRRILARARRAKARDGPQAAARVLQSGIGRFPRAGELWNNLAALQIEQADYAAAQRSARTALACAPELPQAHCNLGIAVAQRGLEAAALECFGRAIELDPGFVAARENQAALLTKLQRVEAAIAAWEAVLRMEPDHARAHAGRGVLLLRTGDLAEARACLDRALVLGLDEPEVRLHRALVEAASGDSLAAQRAMESLRGRIEDAELDWSLAVIKLSQGDFGGGWPLYEARLGRSFESPRRAYPFPEWTGEPVGPGALLVMAEQGLGDEIMFASCYSDALERAPRCVIECDPRLERLFARSFPGASVVGAARDNDRSWLTRHPELRCQVHAGSLPRWFRADAARFPRHAGYLRPDGARVAHWRGRLAGYGEGLKVGIAWKGGLVHTRRSLRCVPLPELAALLRGSGRVFVSLQHDDDGTEAAQLSKLSGATVRAYPEALVDLDEAAALTCALDVVVTACSSVVHLSGALGVATFVLTPRVAEWRYLRSGDALPWYTGARLLRQQRDGEWAPVIADASVMVQALERGRGWGAPVGPGTVPGV